MRKLRKKNNRMRQLKMNEGSIMKFTGKYNFYCNILTEVVVGVYLFTF